MAFIDYSKFLDISKTAAEKEIKSAYRKLAQKYHGDINLNDQEVQRVNEASEVPNNSFW